MSRIMHKNAPASVNRDGTRSKAAKERSKALRAARRSKATR